MARTKKPLPPTLIVNLEGGNIDSVLSNVPGLDGVRVIVTELPKYGSEAREEVEFDYGDGDTRIIYRLASVEPVGPRALTRAIKAAETYEKV